MTAIAGRIRQQSNIMKWGTSDIATIWALVAGITAALGAWTGWRTGKSTDYTRTINLLKEQIAALEQEVARNKVLVEQGTREVFNISVRFEQQQVNYRALGAKFLEATGRIDWLERRERQLVRVLEHHDIDVPTPDHDEEW